MDSLYLLSQEIQGTRIPCILVLAGVLFILSPFAGNFKGKILISRPLQKMTGFVGFVILGVGLWLLLTPPMEGAPRAGDLLPSTPAAIRVIADPFGDDDLQLLKQEVAYLQKEAVDALRKGSLTDADNALLEADTLIDYALIRSPDDRAILNQAGCLYRNMGSAYQTLSMNNQGEQNLDRAEHSFRLIISFNQEDAGAWKSLGDVYILREEFDRAEECVRKAIELDPGYEAARKDLIWILEQQ